MSDPKQVHIQGDVDISVGLDSSLGNGYLYVTSATGGLDVQGTTELDQTTINTTDGLFSVSGSNKISFTPTAAVEIQAAATSYFQTSVGNITIDAQSGILNNTGNSVAIVADTTTATMSGATGVTITSLANNVTVDANANFDVNAQTSITMDATATSNLTTTGGNLTLSAVAGSTSLIGGSALSTAVLIDATNAAGGVKVECGTAGFDVLATSGPFSIDGENAASNLSLSTNANAQDLTIALTGVSDSSLILSSTGTAADAFKITSGNGSTGGIDIDAGTTGIAADTTGPISLGAEGTSDFTVTGAFDLSLISTAGKTIVNAGASTVDAITLTTTNVAGGIDINAGTNGITIDTTAGFSIDSATTSNITLTGTDALTVNNTAGQLVLQSGKTASADAVKITSSSGMDIDAGTTGLTVDSAGLISIDAIGVSSNFTLDTNSSGQNLTLSLTGPAANNELIISSNGDGNASINIDSVNGGIDIDAVKKISLDTTDAVNGITIGTAGSLIPITIGSSTSLTTIAGDLLVSGTTTTVNTETLNVADNIILINSAGGELGNDGGMVIRRNQTPNDVGTVGDVIGDTADTTSSFGVHTATSSNGDWAVTSATEITITTISSGFVFAVGMALTGTGITGSPSIVSFSSGTGGNGSVAVLSVGGQTVAVGSGTLTGTVTHNTSGGTVATASLYTISGTTNLTLTTVATGIFKVGMKITGTGIVGTPVIASFSSGSGASGSVAVLSVAQTNVAGSTNTLTGTYGDTTRVVLNSAASAVDDFYNGWWIKITSGPANGKIRRIKDYIGNIKTAILYTTFDNIDSFTDGLDLGTPPVATNTYGLYNSPYVASFYDESADKWILAYSSVSPDPIAAPGPSTIVVQKYVAFDSGAITIQDNGNPANSTLNVNYINEFTSDIGVTIEGVNLNNGLINGNAVDNTEIVELGVQSTTAVNVEATDVHGSFFVLVDAVQAASGAGSFLRLAQGAFSCFAIASSNIGGGAVNRLASSKGVLNERVDGTWLQGEKFKIQHKPARASGSGNLFYRVKTTRIIAT